MAAFRICGHNRKYTVYKTMHRYFLLLIGRMMTSVKGDIQLIDVEVNII